MPYRSIDAAFRSSTKNECYVFAKDKYVVVNYAPDKRDIINGPMRISDGFPMLAGTVFENGIDWAINIDLELKDTNEAFIFSGNQCAKIKYAPHSSNSRLLIGPIPIASMFPKLKATIFENGINAIFNLIRGDGCYMDYKLKINLSTTNIFSKVPHLDCTVFESGIDAAFNSHNVYEAYIFKGEHYARLNYHPDNKDVDYIVGGGIKRISNDWPALHGLLHY